MNGILDNGKKYFSLLGSGGDAGFGQGSPALIVGEALHLDGGVLNAVDHLGWSARILDDVKPVAVLELLGAGELGLGGVTPRCPQAALMAFACVCFAHTPAPSPASGRVPCLWILWTDPTPGVPDGAPCRCAALPARLSQLVRQGLSGPRPRGQVRLGFRHCSSWRARWRYTCQGARLGRSSHWLASSSRRKRSVTGSQ